MVMNAINEVRNTIQSDHMLAHIKCLFNSKALALHVDGV